MATKFVNAEKKTRKPLIARIQVFDKSDPDHEEDCRNVEPPGLDLEWFKRYLIWAMLNGKQLVITNEKDTATFDAE